MLWEELAGDKVLKNKKNHKLYKVNQISIMPSIKYMAHSLRKDRENFIITVCDLIFIWGVYVLTCEKTQRLRIYLET